MRKYIMSAGWVFPGWIGFSRWFKKEFGVYPPREMLVQLSRMSKVEREENTLLGCICGKLESKGNVEGLCEGSEGTGKGGV